MAMVFLGLGSNTEAQKHIVAGLDALSERFGPLGISRVFESEAVGFAGDNFLNLVVSLETQLSVGQLSAVLKAIEDDNGRRRGDPKFSGRSLDIDILTYDQCCGIIDGVVLPRDEVETNAFVLWPLSELVPGGLHPRSGRTYASLWQGYDRDQKLWPVAFSWQGREISAP